MSQLWFRFSAFVVGLPLACLVGLLLATSVVLLLPVSASAFISTGDGGWLWQNPRPQGSPLNGVAFPDTSHGWVVGNVAADR